MESQMSRIERIREVMTLHGLDLIWGLIFVVVGVIAIKYVNRGIRGLLGRLSVKEPILSTVCNTTYVLMLIILVTTALVEVGLDSRVLFRMLTILALACIFLILVIRPYIPTLPFKVGQTVKAGELLGKVEATSLLNTRLRTFDGRTFFVPNHKIVKEVLLNYHFTPTRRVKVNVGIRYDQDLMKAKQTLEAVMIEDPRVKAAPRPVVYVLNLSNGCVELGGRCWVDNKKYWKSRCELLEKTKLRFDAEGIIIAHPQLDVHCYQGRDASFAMAEGGEQVEV